MSRIKSLDGVRVFATLAIFLYHVGLGMHLAGFAVSLFFMMSGFLCFLQYSHNNIEDGSIVQATKTILVRKFNSFFPIHFIAYLLFVILIYIWEYDETFFIFLLKSALNLSFLQTLTTDYAMILNEPSWYLSCLMICFSVSILYVLMIRKMKKKLIPAFSIFLIIMMWGINIYSIMLYSLRIYTNPIYRSVEFLLGMCIGALYQTSKESFSTICVSILEVISIVVLVGEWVLMFTYDSLSQIHSLGLLPLSLFLLACSTEKGIVSKNILQKRCFYIIAPYTLEFYLLHETILRKIKSLIVIKCHWIVSNIIYALIVGAITVILSYFVHCGIKKARIVKQKS